MILTVERDNFSTKQESICNFKGEYDWLSNFYPVIVTYKSFQFQTVEHAYVASKSNDFRFHKKISQLPSTQAGKAKRLGRQIRMRTNFEIEKISIMKRLLIQKFGYPELKTKLLNTGRLHIVEGNYWHDNFWGDCYCKKCINKKGNNQLGKLIMNIRRTL
jgi:ribA/ribD-fused uncharacterized protein